MVVVPVGTAEDASAVRHLAEQVEVALAERGVTVVSMHEARDRMQAQSRAPVAPDNSDLDVLAREARAAIEHVAFGHSEAAKRSVAEVFRRAERALESLNRETKTARDVLDACLALVRSTLVRGTREEALAGAMRCRRLVPDVTPSEFSHPASVIGVLAEADNQLRRMRIGKLSVESTPQSGCATYVNGRHLGVTPFRMERAAEGEYRVQVECGEAPGRVHLVQLGEKPMELKVDAELDRALRSEARVALVYDAPAQVARLAAAHAAQMARGLRAEEVVMVSIAGAHAQLSRLRASDGGVLGRAHLTWLHVDETQGPEIARSLDALMQGRVEAEPQIGPQVAQTASVAAPAPSETPVARVATRAPRPAGPLRRRRLRISAASLSGAGLSLFFAGVAFEHQRRRADDTLFGLDARDPATEAAIASAHDDYDRGERLRWLGAGGGALLTAAVPMWRVDVSRGVPWWSYAAGGAGLALAAWGTAELARDGACEAALSTGGCANERESAGRGGLLLIAAAPLLALPIDHLLEWKLRGPRVERASASVALGARSIVLTWRAELGKW